MERYKFLVDNEFKYFAIGKIANKQTNQTRNLLIEETGDLKTISDYKHDYKDISKIIEFILKYLYNHVYSLIS